MALNPPPRDYMNVQAIVDAEGGQLRWRRDDERTAAGAGIEHTKFIICPALGVRYQSRAHDRCPMPKPSPSITRAI
jgi:hypothetical protein